MWQFLSYKLQFSVIHGLHQLIGAIADYNWQLIVITQPENIGEQDVPRSYPSNVPRTILKDPIWP